MKSVEELKMHVLVHPVDRQRLTVKLPKTGYTDIEISMPHHAAFLEM